MINLVEFIVGQQYENRKGVYEVLDVQGDTMRIRWEGGDEVDTSVAMQRHIIERMRCELEQLPHIQVVSSEGTPPKGWSWNRH